jgi:hypothetical protein
MTDEALPFFRELEESLFRPEIRTSPSAVDRLLADEFVEFGSSGRAFSKRDVVEGLQHEPPVHRTLTDLHVRPLAPGVILLTYTSVRRDEAHERRFLRSSIWKEIAGRWQMVFHQGTPAE